MALAGAGEVLHDAPAHDVPRRELGHGMDAVHEPLAGCIDQPCTLATDGLADQVPGCTCDVEARRVELHELQVGHRHARAPCHRHGIAGGHLGIRRLAVHLPRTTAGEHHRAGPHDLQAEAWVPGEHTGRASLAGIVTREHIEREAAIEEPDRTECPHPGDECRGERSAGRVAIGVDDAVLAVTSLAPEAHGAIGVTVDPHAPLDHLLDFPGPLAHEHRHRLWIAQACTGLERVGFMLGDAVLGAADRGDAALRPAGARQVE